MATQSIDVILRGATPLMLKNDRTVDPFNPFTVQMKTILDKKKKTDAEKRALRRIEWEAGLYMDDDLGPFVPGWNVVRSLRDGAALTKQGKDIIRGVVAPEKVKIEYDGPRDPEGMYGDGATAFVDVRRVVAKGTGGATIRARPRFDKWALRMTFEFDDEVISRTDLVAIMEKAGRFAGIGEYRPSSPKGGQFGRYTVELVKG